MLRCLGLALLVGAVCPAAWALEGCGQCAWGKLGLAELASAGGCDNRATALVTSNLRTDCPEDYAALTVDEARVVNDKIAACPNGQVGLAAPCLAAVGPQVYVVIAMTAATYVCVLAAAISLRPEVLLKCD